MNDRSQSQLNVFTLAFLVVGTIVAAALIAIATVPDHMNREIAYFVKSSFVPHFTTPINSFKPVSQNELIEEMTAKGFDLTCTGGLARLERVNPRDDYRCWAVLKSAFDDIPARTINYWFQKGVLAHVVISFAPEELSRLHTYLNGALDPDLVQHLGPENQLGIDWDRQLLAWQTPDGVICVNRDVDIAGRENWVMWSSWEGGRINPRQ